MSQDSLQSRNLAVPFVDQGLLENDLMWTVCSGTAPFCWKEIQLCGALGNQIFDSYTRQRLEWCIVKACSDTLLDHSVVPFGFRYMLLSTGVVRLESKFLLHGFQYRSKFVVRIDNGNGETCILVKMKHFG